LAKNRKPKYKEYIPSEPFIYSYLAGYIMDTLGLPLLVAIVLGIWYFLRKQGMWIMLMLLLPVMVFFVFFALQKIMFERNLSYIVPFALLLAAGGVVQVTDWLRNIIPGRRVLAGMTAIMAVSIGYIPAEISYRFLFIELSGKRDQMVAEFEQAMRKKYPEYPTAVIASAYPKESMEKLRPRLDAGQTMLVKVFDFTDEHYSRHGLELLYQALEITPVHVIPSTFEDIGVLDDSYSYIR
jgi:hypothetical protein